MADQFATGVAVPGGASFQPPAMDFSALNNIPKNYFAGQQLQQQQAERQVFRNGIPKDPGTGQPDYGQMADMLARSGAPASDFLPLATANMKFDIARGNASAVAGGPTATPGGGSTTSSSSTDSSNSGGGVPGSYAAKTASAESSGNPNAQNPKSTAGGLYQFTQGTWNDLMQRHPELQLTPQGRFDQDQQQRALPVFTAENEQQLQSGGVPVNDRNRYLAHFLGGSGAVGFFQGMQQQPNAPAYTLASPDAVKSNQEVFFNPNGTPRTARQVYAKLTNRYGGSDQQPGSDPASPQPAQAPTQVASAGPLQVTVGGPGSQPAPAPQGAQAPQPAPGAPQASSAPMNPPPQQGGQPQPQPQISSASALVPPAWQGKEQQYANILSQRAAATATFDPNGATQMGNLAKQINDALAKDHEAPPAVREWQSGRNPGETLPDYQARTSALGEASKLDVTNFDKKYTGIQQLGEAAYNGLQKAALASRLTTDPNFYSGPLEPTVKMYNQFKSVFGENPTAAMPQEAFNKVVTDMLTEQIKALGASGVGRVLQTEVQNMRQSIASLGVTPASNRALLEVVSRVYKQAQDISGISQTVDRKNPGTMTQQLDQKIDQYYRSHPLFTPDELNDPRVLAAPTAPTNIQTVDQARAWGKQQGLNTGDPIRVNGVIKALP